MRKWPFGAGFELWAFAPGAEIIAAPKFLGMAEIRTVTTLRRKHDEITAVIKLYERQLA